MTQRTPKKATGVDWLARRQGACVIDFRLPCDGLDIPADVFADRIGEYYTQLWAAIGIPRRLLESKDGATQHTLL